MKIITFILVMTLSLFFIYFTVQPVQAASIYRIPDSLSFQFFITRDNLTAAQNADMNITSNELDIIDNVQFESPYVLDYAPKDSHLEVGISSIFTLTVGVDYSAMQNTTGMQNETIQTEINVSGEINGTRMNLTSIPLTISVNATIEPLRDYIWRKCFVEEGQEYCTMMNATELENVTITNLTVNEFNYTVLLPFQTAKDYLERYDQKLASSVEEMRRVAESVSEQTNKTLDLAERANRKFQNAFFIDSHMKNDANPIWFELFPSNTLINITGLDLQSFNEAMSVLYEQKSVTQKFEDAFVATPLQDGGVYTRQVKKSYVASTERLTGYERSNTMYTIIFIATAAIIICLAVVGAWELRWKKAPGWGG